MISRMWSHFARLAAGCPLLPGGAGSSRVMGPDARLPSPSPRPTARLNPDLLRKLVSSTPLGMLGLAGAAVVVVSAIQCATEGHTPVPTEGIALAALVAILSSLAIATIWKQD